MYANPKAGIFYPYAGANLPNGFLWCDGAEVSRTEYPELFAAIGTMYGEGNGSTTFNVPNLNGRVPVGRSDEHSLGEMGGEETHALTTEEGPSHSHTLAINGGSTNYGQSRSTVSLGGTYAQGYVDTTAILPTGSSHPHNNMQPYTVVNYIIATGKGTGIGVQDIILGVQAIPLGLEYGGLGATNPKDARQNLEITPENIGAFRINKVWENASPSSEFPAQTVELDLTGYDFIFVQSITSIAEKETGNYMPVVLIPVITGASAAISSFGCDGSDFWGHCRYATIQTNGVAFATGHQIKLNSTTYPGWASRAIPVVIYGVKEVER